MPSLSTLTASNSNVELEGSERAVVSGGTQGVGAGIALRFALAGASVWIVGRSEQRAAAMLEKLNAASEEAQRRRKQNAALQSKTLEADHAFFRADLSDMKEVHRVAAEIKGRAGERGIDWLFESQGELASMVLHTTKKGSLTVRNSLRIEQGAHHRCRRRSCQAVLTHTLRCSVFHALRLQTPFLTPGRSSAASA